MDGFNSNKKYKAFKIPGQQEFKVEGDAIELPKVKAPEPVSQDKEFYEIEYDSCPMPGVGKFVLKAQKIQEPEKDEKRELFSEMREISRTHRSMYDSSRFFDQRVQQNNAIIFYKQAVFMKEFSDDYSGNKPFSQYFPCYQMMGYEQLRTYFTWRTEIRKGNVTDISMSYAFLYIYELLDNIGVNDPQEGLDQLMFFWKAFSVYNNSIDKYVLRWLKDYHIYYELPHSFREFVHKNNLTEHYSKMVDTDDCFELFCNITNYDIRKSNFFTDNKKLIEDCFSFIIDELKQIFVDCGIDFYDSIFKPTKKMLDWKPFKDALFYQWKRQADRRIVLSEKETYICHNNKWFFNKATTFGDSRKLIGYILKQMEAALRKTTKYKFKLSADINTISHDVIDKLKNAGLSLETIINDGVARFYHEETKTVVIVDHEVLSRIRQEALVTQEKLYVPEQEKSYVPVIPKEGKPYVPVVPKEEKPYVLVAPVQEQLDISFITMGDKPSTAPHEIQGTPVSGVWDSLKDELTEVENEALSVVLLGEKDLKKYADECGIMLEVLVDGINEKAMDFVGDNLLDEEFVLYDDYIEQIKEMIK